MRSIPPCPPVRLDSFQKAEGTYCVVPLPTRSLQRMCVMTGTTARGVALSAVGDDYVTVYSTTLSSVDQNWRFWLHLFVQVESRRNVLGSFSAALATSMALGAVPADAYEAEYLKQPTEVCCNIFQTKREPGLK